MPRERESDMYPERERQLNRAKSSRGYSERGRERETDTDGERGRAARSIQESKTSK